jgi:K+/H+ antiporter YhaU regulatory subunit KhtT
MERTGAKVVALERDGEVLVEFGEDFAVRANDILFVCGSVNSLARYQQAFQASIPSDVAAHRL